MPATDSDGSDIEIDLSDSSSEDEEHDQSSSSEGESDHSEPDDKIQPTLISPKKAKQVCESEEEDEPFEAKLLTAVAAEEEDQHPSLQQQAHRREENIRAMLDGSLEIHRKPLLPKLLSVVDATVVLRKPFKSPHPNAPARSESLKRALAARKQFVPWGTAAGKHFQPPIKLAPQTFDDEPEAAAPPIELPPGVEPLVLWEPPAGTEGSPIRVDDALTRFLRPHQREGVQFMFECVSGLRNFEGNGCILADDMGLGKTLQGIALLWTLLNSGHEALGGVPLARRVIICCPTSLVSNWDSECTKWLNGRVRTLPLCESSREDVIFTINQFLSPLNLAQLLIVSYETFRLHAARFQAPNSCDLLICDEAHRLKNDQTLTNRALASLACRRRVLLSGTPMQNQLQEFYSMVNFCNPGVLGTPAQFRKHYEAPVLAGREPDASDSEAALGAERSAQLSEIVNEFILRRTNSLLSAHLPPKVVEVVCCRMTPLQYDLYCHFVQSRSVQNLFATQKSARALSAITSLRKLLNHPKLVYDMVHSSSSHSARASTTGGSGGVEGFEDCGKLFPEGIFDVGRSTGRGGTAAAAGGGGGLPVGWEAMSGKFAVVARMLALLREQTKDRIVIVSNYTQTLDLFTSLCRERGYPCLRLDGSTSISKRQKLVKKFNDVMDNQYVFLLSSKAGGCGLNLIGGNRLILFDMSWNPADDKQAAARVWRDGQRRRVFVYRFMTTGTIEEKVYQRQLSKEGLQAVVDSKEGGAAAGAAVMSLEELRDLFSYDPETLSTTYDHMVATKGLPKKKKPEKPLTKAAKKKAAAAAAKKAAEEEEDEEIVVMSDAEEEAVVIADSEEEQEDLLENDGDVSVAAAAAAAAVPKTLLSAALAAENGGILKLQDGKPKEEDLAAWGHHSDPTTVPDDCMKLCGGNDVTFVFSCQVDGRDVPLDAPLHPLGHGKAATTGGTGLHRGGGGGGGALEGFAMKRSLGVRAAASAAPSVARPVSMPPPRARIGSLKQENTQNNILPLPPKSAAKKNALLTPTPPPVLAPPATVAKQVTPVAAAVVPSHLPQGNGIVLKKSSSTKKTKLQTPVSTSQSTVLVNSGAKSAPAGKITGAKRPSPTGEKASSVKFVKSQPSAATAKSQPTGRKSTEAAPGTAAASAPPNRTAILYDSDDDFI